MRTMTKWLWVGCLAGCSTTTVVTGDGSAVDAGPLVDAVVMGIDATFVPRDSTFPRDVSVVSPDTTVTIDAGPISCGAQAVSIALCPELLCDGLPRWYWSGDECFSIDCGACVGDDCGTSWNDVSSCRAAHATCRPELCRATGGDWLAIDSFCGDFTCDRAPDVACLVGQPACSCGPNRSFDPMRGCIEVECPPMPTRTEQELCAETGGTWTPNICCPTHCGTRCEADCAAPACACGPDSIFDAARGCVVASECLVHGVDEVVPFGHRCQRHLATCECGPSGCGETTCREPMCDRLDAGVDLCGASTRS